MVTYSEAQEVCTLKFAYSKKPVILFEHYNKLIANLDS